MSDEVKLTDKELQKMCSEQAFPGRKSTMGYVTGLSKLEYMTLHIMANGSSRIKEAVQLAKYIIAACNKE